MNDPSAPRSYPLHPSTLCARCLAPDCFIFGSLSSLSRTTLQGTSTMLFGSCLSVALDILNKSDLDLSIIALFHFCRFLCLGFFEGLFDVPRVSQNITLLLRTSEGLLPPGVLFVFTPGKFFSWMIISGLCGFSIELIKR
ncbi:hypothetical protein Tco_1028830 [Tanacetum coccineum]|uniref:Uncharacterized protein n=1 Tax=Tanacetum coccineum TaxID=301880 RepID=A0ABQ5G3B4_9ASTR